MQQISVRAVRVLCAVFLLTTAPHAWANPLPPSPVQDYSPFSDHGVSELGSPTNCGQPIDCQNANESVVLQAANQCAQFAYHFPANLMTEFQTAGDYSNCAVPTAVQSGPGVISKAQWPVCCIIPNSAGSATCHLECHFMRIAQ